MQILIISLLSIALAIITGQALFSCFIRTRKQASEGDGRPAKKPADAYETLEIISELQSQLLRTDDRIIIYRITAEKIRKLLGEGIVIASILDESIQAMRVVAYYGLSVSLDRVVQILGMDPTQSVYYLKDMTDEELKTFRSGRLEHLEGGIRALLTRKAPQMLCDMIETLLGVDSVYTIAFRWQGQHLGGVTILTRQDLSSKRESIEMIMNQAAITINRIRVEAQLRQSEEKYRLIAENVADVITKLDMNLRILYVSPSIRRLLGFTADEHKSRTIDQIMTRESFELVTKVLEEELRLEATGAADPDRSRALVLETYRKDGSCILVENTLSFIRDSSQKAVGILSVARDVTERKAIENQLFQAQKMESIGRLAGGVAHDYNNMLSLILGYTELAMEKIPPSDPTHADLVEINNAAARSVDITRQLLAFARKQTIVPKVVDLNAIVESMLKMLRRLIGENIELTWSPGTELWPVKVDPAQVDQILANLCVNARDAIAGAGKIAIETKNIEIDEVYGKKNGGCAPGVYVALAISDNGAGMDKKTLKNIFEPFFTTKNVDKGTGLGLATIYGIVKQNDGFINVYSEPGVGSTFKIYLPRHVGDVQEKMTTQVSPAPLSKGETVLLVEDEPAIMKMTQLMLKRLGYKVLMAGTPSRAVALAEEHAGNIDLLISDVVMPEMDGRTLSDRIIAIRPGIKTLFMSGYTANIIAGHGVVEEGTNFMQKPFSVNDLGAKIRSVLGR